MKKFWTVLVLLFIATTVFASVSLRDVVPNFPEEDYQKVLSGELVEYTSYADDIRLMVPANSMIVDTVEEALQIEKGFVITILGMIPYPEKWANMTEEEIDLEMFNKSLEISTMSGITYISRRAGYKEKTLFKKSSMLGSADKKNKIEDPSFDYTLDAFDCYVFQDDTSFGDNIYSAHYRTKPNELFIYMDNYNSLSVMGISVVAPTKVLMCLDMIRTDEGLLVFGMSRVKDKKPQFNVMGYKVDVEESIMNRVISLKNWYAAQIHK